MAAKYQFMPAGYPNAWVVYTGGDVVGTFHRAPPEDYLLVQNSQMRMTKKIFRGIFAKAAKLAALSDGTLKPGDARYSEEE